MNPINSINPDYYKNTNNQSSLIKMINLGEFDFSLGNAIKYIYRAGRKDDFDQDIKKAIWYLENFLEVRIDFLLKNKFMISKNNLTIEQITSFINDAEITIHQKEWLIDLLQYKTTHDAVEYQEQIKKIKGVLYSLKCYLNQQNLFGA